MKLVAKEMSLASIVAMTPEEQNHLAQKFVAGNTSVKVDKDALKETAKVIGKVLCALEIRLNAGIAARAFPANTSLAEFFKQITGEKPQTHVLTLKNAYGAFVETGFITENDYDVNSGNCLELAVAIVKAVENDLTHDAIPLAALELKERGNKEARNLRDLLARVKPASKLTPTEALEMLQQIADDGQLAVVTAELPDIILKMTEAEQRSHYLGFIRAVERFDKALGEKIDQWMNAEDAKNAPVQLVKQAA